MGFCDRVFLAVGEAWDLQNGSNTNKAVYFINCMKGDLSRLGLIICLLWNVSFLTLRLMWGESTNSNEESLFLLPQMFLFRSEHNCSASKSRCFNADLKYKILNQCCKFWCIWTRCVLSTRRISGEIFFYVLLLSIQTRKVVFQLPQMLFYIFQVQINNLQVNHVALMLIWYF